MIDGLGHALKVHDSLRRDLLPMTDLIGQMSTSLINVQAINRLNESIVGPGVLDSLKLAIAPVLDLQATLLRQSFLVDTQLNRSIASVVSALPDASGITRLAEQLNAIVAPLQAMTESFSKSIRAIDFEGIGESLAALLPPNWPDDIRLGVAQKVINDFGIPLVWLPRAEVVTLLTEAPDHMTSLGVLIENSTVIVADIRQCLDDVDDVPELVSQVALARSAVNTYEAGMVPAAQALATVVLDSLVLAYVGGHSQVPKKVKRLSNDTPLRGLIRSASLSPLVPAYEPFWADRGDPIPTNYNRHATVHGGSEIQFTDENALISLMVVASLLKTLRQIHGLGIRDVA